MENWNLDPLRVVRKSCIFSPIDITSAPILHLSQLLGFKAVYNSQSIRIGIERKAAINTCRQLSFKRGTLAFMSAK